MPSGECVSKFSFENPKFIKTAMNKSHYPKLVNASGKEMPQVAVVGRSNVGKSSLMNYLFKRKNLVKTSATPGKTQAVNFFTVDDALGIVDLPGYGYAKVAKSTKEGWGQMIEDYLLTCSSLYLVLFLFDIRRQPTEEDRQLIEWLAKKGMMVILVITKVDKVGKNECLSNTQKILSAFALDDLHHVHTSATNRVGRKELIALVNEALKSAETGTKK